MRISDWSSDVCSSDLKKVIGNGKKYQLINTVTGTYLGYPTTDHSFVLKSLISGREISFPNATNVVISGDQLYFQTLRDSSVLLNLFNITSWQEQVIWKGKNIVLQTSDANGNNVIFVERKPRPLVSVDIVWPFKRESGEIG